MDKQRKIILILIITGVVILGVSVYFGMNYQINRFDKKSNMAINSELDSNIEPVHIDHTIEYANGQMIFTNIDLNYRISFPDYWPEPVTDNVFDLSFIYTGLNEESVPTGAMMIRIYEQPADSSLSLLDNIKIFYENVKNVHEVKINGTPVIKVDNLQDGINRTVFVIDSKTEEMIVIDGTDLDSTEISTFSEKFDQIIDTLTII